MSKEKNKAAQAMAAARWKNVSPSQRLAHAHKMNKARAEMQRKRRELAKSGFILRMMAHLYSLDNP